jgi:chaperonin cofactor prefoldin
MNKLWDDLKDNMKEWGASAVEKAEEISRVAVAKGEEFTKISKLKYDISQVQKDKTKIYEKLGRLVFEKTKNNNMANFTANKEFFGLVEEVDSLSNDIADKEVEIVNIKKEYGINDSDIEINLDATIENSLQEEE